MNHSETLFELKSGITFFGGLSCLPISFATSFTGNNIFPDYRNGVILV